MDRKEFSDLLMQVRIDSKLSRYAVCKILNVAEVSIRRIETASNNYGIDKVFGYLEGIHKCIFLSNGKKTFIVGTENDFLNWAINESRTIGPCKLAQQTGLSMVTILNFQNKKTVASIDTCLKIIQVLGYKIDKIC